ncbi:MAG: hypothetical protein H7Z41_11305 [Cytophagales bacterium]|nr:hypothetical protein [Armatimonadota bacterium]
MPPGAENNPPPPPNQRPMRPVGRQNLAEQVMPLAKEAVAAAAQVLGQKVAGGAGGSGGLGGAVASQAINGIASVPFAQTPIPQALTGVVAQAASSAAAQAVGGLPGALTGQALTQAINGATPDAIARQALSGAANAATGAATDAVATALNGRDSPAFRRAMEFLGPWEGGYVNDPADSGGATNRGVTQGVYDNHRRGNNVPLRDVRQLTDEEHDDIYYNRYWAPSHADRLPENLGIAQFDWAVNHGVSGATRTLQESVGLTGRAVDGVWGPGTEQAVANALAQPNGQAAVVDTYLNNRAEWYRNRAQENPSQQRFLNGWLNRVDSPPDANGRMGLRNFLTPPPVPETGSGTNGR